MRDNRVTQLATANALAHQYRHYPIFVFKSGEAKAVYIFGKMTYKSKAWNADHVEPFRSAYKRYHQRVEHILRKPTEAELAGMLPAFHPLERKDGKPMTVGDYQDFTRKVWHSKQVSDIIRLIQQEGVQYIREDVNDMQEQIKHFDKTHFTAVTIGGRKFLYCPVGNICSWSEGDYDHKWCEWCKKGFEEISNA